MVTNLFVLAKTKKTMRNIAIMMNCSRIFTLSERYMSQQTFERRINYVYEAKDVVATGLKDLYRSKKDISIHGLPVKLQVLGVKLLPHKFVMKTWMNQQKKPLHNEGLTTK